MLSIQKALLLSAALFLTQACSGGGGGDDGSSDGGTSGGDGGTGSGSSNFTVTTDVTSIAISKEFQKLNDSDPQEIQVTYTGDLIPRLLTQTVLTNSISIDVENVNETGASSTATVVVDIDDTHLLLPNLYTTTLGVAAGLAEGTTLDIDEENVTVSVLVAEKIHFRTVTGNNAIPEVTSTIISNTSDTWTVSNNADWLTSELNVNGSVSLTNTVESSLLDGTNPTAEITLTNTTTQQEFTIPVEVALDDAYIFADQAAISFVSTENIDNTFANLNISNNSGSETLDYTVESNVTWLDFEQSNEGKLLRVDVDILDGTFTTNDLSLAEITITPTAGNMIGQTIPVSLFHSDNEVEFSSITDTLELNSNAIVVSPVNPYVYVGSDNTVKVYHQFTGALLNTIAVSPTGTTLTNFIIHPDGSTLFTQTGEAPSSISYKVNLENSPTATEISTAEIKSDPVAFIQSSGRYFIVTEEMEFADENLELLNTQNNTSFVPSHISIAKSANTIFAVNDETNTINRFIIGANFAATDKVLTFLTHTSPALNGEISDIAVSSNASNIYIVNETTEHVSFNGTSFVDNGLLEVDSGFILADNSGNLTGLFTPDEGDVTTHSVSINYNNEPFYLRTVAVSNTEFQTHLYQYNNSQQHISNSFIETAATLPTTAPVDFTFTSSNNHVVSFNTNDNVLNVTAAPFMSILNTNNLTTTNRQKSDNTSTTTSLLNMELGNISTDWTWLPPQAPLESPWLLFSTAITEPQILNITLSAATDNLDVGVYERDIYIYDIKNKISARLKLELNLTN